MNIYIHSIVSIVAASHFQIYPKIFNIDFRIALGTISWNLQSSTLHPWCIYWVLYSLNMSSGYIGCKEAANNYQNRFRDLFFTRSGPGNESIENRLPNNYFWPPSCIYSVLYSMARWRGDRRSLDSIGGTWRGIWEALETYLRRPGWQRAPGGSRRLRSQ